MQIKKKNKQILDFYKRIEKFNDNNIFDYLEKNINEKFNDNSGKSNLKLFNNLIGVKSNIPIKHFPLHAGIKEYENNISNHTHPLIKKIINNGGVIAGTTNMDEAALGGATNTGFNGKCLNPIDKSYTCGGSSGGSAAAVKAKLVDIAIGTDTMGSVRIPASYCGVYGFKPSYKFAKAKKIINLTNSYDCFGFLSNDLKKIIKVFSLIHNSPIKEIDDHQIKEFNILIPLNIFNLKDVEKKTIREFNIIIEKLKRKKVNIFYKNLDFWNPTSLRVNFFKLVEIEAYKIFKTMVDNPNSKISHRLRSYLSYGKKQTPAQIKKIKSELKVFQEQFKDTFKKFDFIILPTTPQKAFKLESSNFENQADFTCLANILDLPAISIPIENRTKFPFGLQIMGKSQKDLLTLNYTYYLLKKMSSLD